MIRYALAAGVIGAAVALRAALSDALGETLPTLTLIPAIIFVASSCGRGPTWLAIGLGAAAAAIWLIPPAGTRTITLPHLLELALFATVGVMVDVLRNRASPSPPAARPPAPAFPAAAAAEVDRHLKHLVETNVFGIAWGTFDGTITYANDYFLRMTGYARQDLEQGNLRWDMFTPSQWLHLDERAAHELRTRGVATPFEKEYLRKDGTRFPILVGGALAPARNARGADVIAFYLDMSDRRRGGDDETRARLAAIVESSDDAILSKSLDGTITSWNRAAERIFGYRAAEVIGKPISVIVPPERSHEVETILGRLRLGERLEHHETVRVRKDGRRIDVSLTISPIFDERGNVVGASKIARDVSERKRAEAELAEANSRFRLAAEAVNALIYDWDVVSGHVVRSRGLAELVGYDPADAEPTMDWFARLVHPEDLPRFAQLDAERLQDRGGFSIEYRVCHRDGTWRTVWDRGIAVRDASGRLARVIGATIDITDRRNAEERLRASEERFRSLLSATTSIVWTTGPEGGFVEPQPSWEAFTGQAWAEHAGWGWADAVHPDDRAATVRAWNDGRRRPSPYENEHRLRHRDGSWRHVIARAVPVLHPNGSIREWVGMCIDVTQQKRAEAARRESEGRFRAMADSAPVLIWICDTQNKSTWFNKPWLEFVCRPIEQELGDGWIENVHPDDRAHCLRICGGSFERREPFTMEFRLRRGGEDGGYRWVLDSGTPHYDEAGNFVGYIGSVIDITDRKLAEQALAESEARTRAILETAVDAIITINADGVIESVNPAAERLFGYSAAEMIGRNVSLLMPSPYADEHDGYLRNYLCSGVPRIIGIGREVTGRRKNGSHFAMDLAVSEVKLGDGRRVFTGIVHDISEHKRIQQSLRRQTEAIQTINAVGRTLLAELDMQRLVQTVTDAGTALTRAEFGAFFYNVLDEAGDRYMLYTLSGAPRDAFEKFGMPRNTEVFAPTFRGERTVRCDDVTADPRYGKNGPHFGMPAGHLPVRSYLAVPVVSRGGDVWGGLFFGHSKAGVFTERDEQIIGGIAAQAAVALDNARLLQDAQRSREQAERANRMKDEFLATLGHELRTPLNAILGWAQLLRGRSIDESELRSGLETIERNARSQSKLIEDLLDMSRIVSGKVRLEMGRVELASVVDAAVAAIRPAADAKEIRVSRSVNPAGAGCGPVICGDADRLQQVVWNLLSNAIKFTPRGGAVSIELRQDEAEVELRVSDTGPGIAPEFMPYLFDRFRQAEQGTTRKHAGLGLGLSIVKSLVELHGGSLRAESEGENRGATFIVTLPGAPSSAAPGMAVAAMSGPDDGHPLAVRDRCSDAAAVPLKGVRVLVVDDEPDARDLVRRLLEHSGAAVATAASAAEALRLFASAHPDVLLSDIGMPDEDGYALIRRLRQLPPERGGRTPAAALTAFARLEDRTRAMLSGFQMHVAKPVEPSELIAVVASLAGRVDR